MLHANDFPYPNGQGSVVEQPLGLDCHQQMADHEQNLGQVHAVCRMLACEHLYMLLLNCSSRHAAIRLLQIWSLLSGDPRCLTGLPFLSWVVLCLRREACVVHTHLAAC
jgi:hypothetical protein